MNNPIQAFNQRQHMNNKTFEIFHYSDTQLRSVTLHHHDFYEIYFLLDGEVECLIEGKTYSLNKGDLLFIPPLKLHQQRVKNDCIYQRMVLWINRNYLSSISSSENLTDCFNLNGTYCVSLSKLEATQSDGVSKLFEILNREANSNAYGNEIYAKGVFMQLLVELNRLVRLKKNQSHLENHVKLVDRVISYINENYSKNLSLDLLASKFFVSKYHLSHEFSQQVGIGIYRYITLKRLSLAKKQLSKGISANVVCNNCGFNNYASFYRTFKSKYGISPCQYVEQINS